MTLAIKIVVAIVIVLFIAVAVLRVRKLRRDEMRELSRPVERRLMTPPPSPYQPSKGFRLLDGADDVARRSQPSRPRLDTSHDYVFGETHAPGYDDVRLTTTRHNESWALTRSSRHSSLPGVGLMIVAVAVALALVIGVVIYYTSGSSHPGSPSVPPHTTTSVRSHTTTTRAHAAARWVTRGVALAEGTQPVREAA